MKKIGFIGLGNMGKNMVRNLLKKGFEVTVYDVRPEPIEELKKDGAKGAATLKELGEAADIVFVMVLNFAQVKAATIDADGVVNFMKPGSIVIVTSTIAQSETRMVAEFAAKRGVHMVDSPVSGGTIGAEAGSLVMMAAAPKKVFEEAREALFAVGSNTYHVGEEVGMGQTVKAANQLLVSIHVVAAAEAMVLSQKAGVDPEMLVEIISKSVGTSYMFNLKAPMIMNRDFANRGALDIQIKDLDICLKMGRELQVPLFLSAASRELYIMAEGMGWGREDLCAVTKVYEQSAKVQVEKKK